MVSSKLMLFKNIPSRPMAWMVTTSTRFLIAATFSGSTPVFSNSLTSSLRRSLVTYISSESFSCSSRSVTLSMAGPIASIRSASRESSWAISATGTRSSVIKSRALPILKKEYTAAKAARTAKAEIPRNASRRRPRTPNFGDDAESGLFSCTDPPMGVSCPALLEAKSRQPPATAPVYLPSTRM